MVDLRYLWTEEASNSEGSKAAIISVTPNETTYCSFMEVVYYVSSKSDGVFYKIEWVGTGMFDNETAKLDSNKITVLIDPKSGKIVDIVAPNYYYTIKNNGRNKISMIRYDDEIVWDET